MEVIFFFVVKLCIWEGELIKVCTWAICGSAKAGFKVLEPCPEGQNAKHHYAWCYRNSVAEQSLARVLEDRKRQL